MEILGVITARKNSQRLANKNISPLLGKPVIAYTVEAARKSTMLTRIVCSTDSPQVMRIVEKRGIQAITRPARLARNTSPIEEAVRHAVSYLRKTDSYDPQVVVLLYGNVPYRAPHLIDDALRLLIAEKADAVVSISPTDRYHPERLVLTDAKKRYIPYSRQLSTYRSQELPQMYFIDSGVIAFKTGLLFGPDPLVISHYFKGYKVRALASATVAAWDIDVPFDWDIAEAVIKRKHKNGFII